MENTEKVLNQVLLRFMFICFFCCGSMQALHDKIMIIAIPKSGTHMVMALLRSLTNKSFVNQRSYVTLEQGLSVLNAGILVSHAVYNQRNCEIAKQSNVRVIFISRDPRDQVVSDVYWIYKEGLPFYNEAIKRGFSALLSDLIVDGSSLRSNFKPEFGITPPVGIQNFYASYLPWAKEPFVYATTFEKLVGPKGGGSQEVQLNEIVNIAHHIGLSITRADAQRIANDLFGSAGTFRAGQIGSWKEHFSAKDKQAFKDLGSFLVDLGYEESLDW